MALTSQAGLAFYLRGALEQWTREYLNGPWDDLIHELATAIDAGELTLTRAARIDYLLRATTGADVLPQNADCPICDCPMPGLSHVGGPFDQGDAADGGTYGPH